MAALDPSAFALVALVVGFGGFVKGAAGFGYAIASTALLATLISPETAIVLMILPMLVANLSLLRDLTWNEIAGCLARFWPYVATAMAGTALGMVLLEEIPTTALTLALGAFTLLYVIMKQPWVGVPGTQRLMAYCFRRGNGSKAILGFVSGIVFGLSNVAVQVVAYLDSLRLDRSTFVGVLAMILVGIAGLRVGIAWTLGMYQSEGLLIYSAAVSLPGLLGVEVGKRVRSTLPTGYEQGGVLLLLTVIGIRLTVSGL